MSDAAQQAAMAAMPGGGIVQGVKAIREVTDAVRDGDIQVSEELGEDLRRALATMENELGTSVTRLRAASEKLPLGGHEYAQQVSQHTRETLEGGPESALQSLHELQEVLADAHDALESAKRQYQEYEDSAGQNIGDKGEL